MDPSTSPDEVAAPVRLVELADLKTLAGGTVRVYVERLPEERLVDIMRQLPGESARPTGRPSDEEKAVEDESRARKWLGWAQPLIEAASFMVRADGTEVRPAFRWVAEGVSPGASVRGSYLSARDRTQLMQAILALSGWTKEAAAPTSFHVRDGAGGERGAGNLVTGEGQQSDAVGSSA